MNSRVSNCSELHKFWHYSTDLGTNSYSRDQIACQFFLSVFDHYSYWMGGELTYYTKRVVTVSAYVCGKGLAMDNLNVARWQFTVQITVMLFAFTEMFIFDFTVSDWTCSQIALVRMSKIWNRRQWTTSFLRMLEFYWSFVLLCVIRANVMAP